MASIIRIKRSSTSGNPSTLGAGELAYSALTDNGSNGGDRLYIGIGAETAGNAVNHFVIGGKYFTDMMDHARGTLTASSAILVDSDSKIDNLKVDNLDLNGNTISSTDTNGNIVLDPAGTGYVSIVGTNGVVIPVGTDLQRGPSIQGTIRYNTDSSSFEGYSGTTWGSLGGVKSVDGLTFITAESTPGASDDTLSFVTNGTQAMSVDTDSIDIATKIATVNINATTTSTSTTTGALVVDGGVGVGGALYVSGAISAASASFASINDTPIGNVTPNTGAFTLLDVDNIRIDSNTISSTNTNGDISITPNGSGKTIITNIYTDGSTSLTEFVQDITGGQIVAGEGIDVTYDDTAGTTTIDAEIATTSNRGVASFDTNDFNVTSGAVELKDTVVKGLTVDANATVTPSAHSVQITGGEGIDVTASGSVITVTGEDASTSNKGVASFQTDDFNVTSGEVELKDTVVKTITTDSGALTPSAHGLSILGGEGMDVTHTGTTITVAGEDATVNNKGIASFDTDNFTVTSGAVSTKNITLGTSTLTNGSTTATLAGLQQLDVDNIRIDGNEISSTDTNGNISLNPNGTGTVDVNNSRITSLADPTGSQDAATKAYVDAVAEGLSVKPAVRAATTADLGATYDNGTAGVGSTLTIPATATLSIDGVNSWSVYDGILVKDQTNAEENGRYFVSTIGNVSAAWVLTRCGKCDEPSEIPSMYVFVQEGTVYNSTGWVATVSTLPLVVGTGAIDFVQFSGAGTYLAGDALGITGSTFNVLVAASGGIEISSDALQLKSSVAGAGLTYTSGVLDVVGTANRITVNTDSIDIASTYVGQNSITTLGTIATGTWQGTVIADAYIADDLTISGGTINNTPIGATTRSTGAFTTLTANNSVTFTLGTDATSISSAAVVLDGGLAVNKKIYVGDDLIGAGAATSDLSGFNIDGGTY